MLSKIIGMLFATKELLTLTATRKESLAYLLGDESDHEDRWIKFMLHEERNYMRYLVVEIFDGSGKTLTSSDSLENITEKLEEWWKVNSGRVAFSIDGLDCKIYDTLEKKFL